MRVIFSCRPDRIIAFTNDVNNARAIAFYLRGLANLFDSDHVVRLDSFRKNKDRYVNVGGLGGHSTSLVGAVNSVMRSRGEKPLSKSSMLDVEAFSEATWILSSSGLRNVWSRYDRTVDTSWIFMEF